MSTEPTTAELLGIDKPPARASGLAGMLRTKRQETTAPKAPDFAALPQEPTERLRALEAIIRQEETTYTTTVRAAKERFTTTGGIALRMIQQEELWRDDEGTHADFFAYAKSVWGYEKSHVYLLLDSVKIREAISDPEAHLNTSHLKKLGPALRKDGPEVVKLAWEQADIATGGKVTGTALVKALAEARTAGASMTQADNDATPSSPQAVDALEDALRAQKRVWAALAPAAISQAMQHDPDRTKALLAELERQAVRTTKRARATQ